MAPLPTVTGRPTGAALPEAADGPGPRLRRRLVESGPIAARFGIYLGSRVDLLSGTDCLRLLEIPDRAPASGRELVERLLHRELGRGPEELFADFEPEPFDSGLLFQWHHARLPGGEAVTVQLLHPELGPALEDGGLRRIAEELVAGEQLPAATRAAVEDFERQLDLRQASADLARLASETKDSRWVEVPRVYPHLCSRRICVQSSLRDRYAEPPVEAEGGGNGFGETRARRLGRIWFAMAIGGDLFPVEPWGRNIRHLDRGRVALLGGELRRLPRFSQAEIRDYLAAVAAGDAARAAMAFLDLLQKRSNIRRLRDRIRHVDPFRDPGWDVGGDLFARQVLAQWRLAAELGHPLPEGVLPFYRGLFLLNQETRRLAGEVDSVRDGFREARLLLLLGEWRREGEEGRWVTAVERQIDLWIRLPERLERILALAAEFDHPREGSRASGEREPRRRSAWKPVAACLLALTTVVVLTRYLTGVGIDGAWVERSGALVALLLGGLLLKAATGPD